MNRIAAAGKVIAHAAAAAALLSHPRTAFGAEPARVLLWPDLGAIPSPIVEEELAQALRARVEDIVRSETIRADPEVAARQRAHEQDLLAVEGTLAKARRAYLAFDFGTARQGLEQLLKEHLPLLSERSQSSLLAAALRLSAQVELADGREAVAKDRLSVAILVLPEDPARASATPELLKLEAEIRGQAARAAFRRLTVTSSPPGALVTLDGRPTGVTPLTADARPGPHVVRWELPGHAAAARFVPMTTTATPIDVTLAGDPTDAVLLGDIARGALDVDSGAARGALLSRARATLLLAYRPDGPATSVRVLSSASSPRAVIRGDLSDLGTRTKLADAVADRPQAVPAQAIALDPVPIPSPEPPLYRRPWVWATVGAITLSAAIVIPLATRPEQRAHVKAAAR